MADVDVNRSVRFVSLDTHPANNSLVVTYEILISVLERPTNRELTRRSKRDQLQIKISALDKLAEDELRQSDRLALNLRALSEDIISKCPLLGSVDRGNVIEDIQLHLLYLLNRRQTQLISANNPAVPDRPQSSASMARLKSAPSGPAKTDLNRLRAGSSTSGSRQRSALSSSGSSRESLRDAEGDVYDHMLAREKEKPLEQAEQVDKFMQQFEAHLDQMEHSLSINNNKDDDHKHLDDLETKLEGLYGEEGERLASMVWIRRASCDARHLLSMSSNRILICAILRTFRDHKENVDQREESRGQLLRESILFCLIRMTSYEDVYARLFADGNDEMKDLLRVVMASLDEQVAMLVKLDDSHKLIQLSYYHLNSLLVLIMNLLQLDSSGHMDSRSTKHSLLQVHSAKLMASFVGLVHLIAKYLARDLRQSLISEQGGCVATLSRLLTILLPLSIYREFIQLLRAPNKQKQKQKQQEQPPNSSSKSRGIYLIDSLMNILNTLQLSRPGSGQSASEQGQLTVIRDQPTLNEIYALEMDILRLLNNLLFDARLKTRLIKRLLPLKCVLRNVIVFLASKGRTSSTLSPFNRSSALLVPFRCLYELSCNDHIKTELFRSKIIIKCLFEYLLTSSTDLKSTLALLAAGGTGGAAKVDAQTANTGGRHRNDTTNEIIIEPNDASHFIVCLWLNLSAKPSASFYSPSEADLQESLRDYIDLTIGNLSAFVRSMTGHRKQHQQASLAAINRDLHLMVYIHVKLLRNLSQFYGFKRQEETGGQPQQLNGWMESLAKTSDYLLSRSDVQEFALLSVECLAILSHMIVGAASGGSSDGTTSFQSSSRSLLTRLLEVNFASLDAENDDLILVSIDFLGNLAKYQEICAQIPVVYGKILEACEFVLENKSTDMEMIVSCLFTFNQLLEHRQFLAEIVGSLNADQTNELDNQRQQVIGRLVDRLAGLVCHPDVAAMRLANLIVNKLKQLEEEHSLLDSVACQRRFVNYNNKWLSGVVAGGASPTGPAGHDHQDELDEDELLVINEYRRPRLIDAREAPRLADEDQEPHHENQSTDETGRLGEDEDEDEDDEDDDEDDESFSGQPDLNVIDANSMTRHLTNRRQSRAEWLRR